MNSKWEYLFKYCFHTMNNDITTINVCKEVEAYPVKRFCHVLSVGNNSSCNRGLISNRIHRKWQPSLTAGNHFSSLPHLCFEKTIEHLVVDTSRYGTIPTKRVALPTSRNSWIGLVKALRALQKSMAWKHWKSTVKGVWVLLDSGENYRKKYLQDAGFDINSSYKKNSFKKIERYFDTPTHVGTELVVSTQLNISVKSCQMQQVHTCLPAFHRSKWT